MFLIFSLTGRGAQDEQALRSHLARQRGGRGRPFYAPVFDDEPRIPSRAGTPRPSSLPRSLPS